MKRDTARARASDRRQRRDGPPHQRWVRALLRRPVRMLWPVDVAGAAHVPASGAAVLCPNHLSFFDSVFMTLSFDRPVHFIGKSEYLESWTTRTLFPAMGMIPIDRDSGTRGMVALDEAEGVLRDGALLCIYPEGTRSRDGRLHRGHTGAARLASAVDEPRRPGDHRRVDAPHRIPSGQEYVAQHSPRARPESGPLEPHRQRRPSSRSPADERCPLTGAR